ncbi:nicotinamide riboside transporter PnuC [Eupransor demetentiae]|uniref:Nicotinamide riboside transporter PnuC (PnuC) n=1 Tax=Eupransor demetentiae TaxID=3109584 RepID=A0ABM9N3N6_9LACO|nr:Nicotinamide riboside transporter PnuC (PnuC) [Lactobacillaceae bacterium LMG 33000]
MIEDTQNPYSWPAIRHNIRQVFTWQYYKEGFSGWDTHTYVWWLIGLVIIVATGLMHGINSLTMMSMLGGAIGFTCTLAITSNKKINGLLGFVSAIFISIVALNAKNYAEIVMQMTYLITLDLNFMLFGDAWQNRKIRAMDKRGWFLMGIAFVIAFTAMYIMDNMIFISPRHILDPLTATIGITGAVLTVAKYKSQYWMWTLSGLISVFLWGKTALAGDTNWVLFATYILYLGNDVIGLFFSPWAREVKKQKQNF